jgi:hypothetical protein
MKQEGVPPVPPTDYIFKKGSNIYKEYKIKKQHYTIELSHVFMCCTLDFFTLWITWITKVNSDLKVSIHFWTEGSSLLKIQAFLSL